MGIGKGTKYELNITGKVSENNGGQEWVRTKNKNRRSLLLYNEIMAVCADFEPLSSIAIQVKRNLRYLKNSVIPDMVAEGLLIRKYPETSSHPDQQYKAGKKE